MDVRAFVGVSSETEESLPGTGAVVAVTSTLNEKAPPVTSPPWE